MSRFTPRTGSTAKPVKGHLAAIGPIAARVILQKATLLEEVADASANLDRLDDAGFADIIRAFEEAGFPVSRMAHHTGVKCSTVTRWSHGQSSPHPAGRLIIVRHLAEKARLLASAARDEIDPPALSVAA